MSTVFIKIFNMSINAGWLILVIAFARFLYKEAPKWVPCILWGFVAVRLVCPVYFKSVLSLIPSPETIPSDFAVTSEPAVNSGIGIINNSINPVIAGSFTPDPSNSVNPLQILVSVATVLWLAVAGAMLVYALVSWARLRIKVSASVNMGGNIMACDDIGAPFILGIIRPMIYVPSSMTGETLEHVIRHERAHLKRRDHWWKPLGFLLLSIYWFNPLCWLAYILLCRDIEMACDERVIRDMDREQVAAYSQALLDCSFSRKGINACPLAFGEVGVKERVKGVLNYKKPGFWIMGTAITACLVLSVLFLTDPKTDASGKSFSDKNQSETSPVAVDNQNETSPVALFEVIMSSPMYSSNSAAYLEAHEEEHKKLLENRDSTLRYIYGEFIRGRNGEYENGLKGVLMVTVLRELEPEFETLVTEGKVAGPAQDCFNAFADRVMQLRDEHGEEWLKTEQPDMYLLLSLMTDKN